MATFYNSFILSSRLGFKPVFSGLNPKLSALLPLERNPHWPSHFFYESSSLLILSTQFLSLETTSTGLTVAFFSSAISYNFIIIGWRFGNKNSLLTYNSGMQNFQQILTQAAQLKEHQLKKDRKGYESLPEFLKSGLGFNKKYELIRKQHFLFQFRISNKVKESGNALFKQNKIEQALSHYEEALAIFRYIDSTTYENMKDQNMSYHFYEGNQLSSELKQKYHTHLCALYLNICSCLTKLNKKDDAIYSADQALKIKKTAKAHYKKAQAYLKYVNRDANDIKLGILELKQAYSIQKDPGMLNEMVAAKENYEKEKEKSKNWFKFMFDKNKEAVEDKKNSDSPPETPIQKINQKNQKPKQQNRQEEVRRKQMQQLTRHASQSDEKNKFEQTKQKLKCYLTMGEEEWEQTYQKQFMKRNGSKIYSLLKIYKHQDLASQYRLLFAKCLQPNDKSAQSCKQCIEWIKSHPIEQIKKYVERYDLQTDWIRKNRTKEQPIHPIKEEFEEKKMVKQEDLDLFSTHKPQIPVEQPIRTERVRENREPVQSYVNNSMEMGAEQLQKVPLTKEEKKRYITVGIILFLILVRFLWN